jgi:hypothetical protein
VLTAINAIEEQTTMDPDNRRKAPSEPEYIDLIEKAPEQSWVSTASRTAGRLARRVASGLDTVTGAMVGHRRPRATSLADLDALLGQLGRMVQSGVGAYGALKDREDFWALVARISTYRRMFERRASGQTEPAGG